MPLRDLRAKAAVYLEAARGWAVRAAEATRLLKGEDCPAFEVWTEALHSGCWASGGGEGGGGGGKAFFERWAEAGLSSPLPHDQPVVLAGKRVGFTSFAACG